MDGIVKEANKILKMKRILRTNEYLYFNVKEGVKYSDYYKDLYDDEDVNHNADVTVYWDFIKRRDSYYEIYVSFLCANKVYLSVFKNEMLEFKIQL